MNQKSRAMTSSFSTCLWAVVLGLLTFQCAPSPSEQVVHKLQQAEALLAKGDTLRTLATLDSLLKSDLKTVPEMGKVASLNQKIYKDQFAKLQAKLTRQQQAVAPLLTKFKGDKGEFTHLTEYIYNRQAQDQSWSRSFIQALVDEHGQLTLLSRFIGDKQLNHTSFRVEGEGLSMQTDPVPVGSNANYQGEFNGIKWEKVMYQGSRADSLIQLIATHADRKWKAIYQGGGYYVIWIEESDKQAIQSVYQLAIALRQQKALEADLASIQGKITP